MTLPVKTKVLIVDDSAVIRAIIRRTLEQDDRIEIVGPACDGAEAVSMTAQFRPDIIILDIEMPVMDGLSALPLILKEKADAKVLICSTLSARGADISMRAISLGAVDCILKPGGESITTAHDFQAGLLRTVNSLARGGQGPNTALPPVCRIKQGSILPPRVLAIGSSTGGPKALADVLESLESLPVPIVITQHMPKIFTALFAQNLEQSCGFPCCEGAEGMILRPGCAYVAPGGLHMTFVQTPAGVAIRLNDGLPENFCKPSVNPMLRSLTQVYGGRVQVAILTGMGADGLEGCQSVVEQGGQVVAQDEATSVVWGMPGAVCKAGLCAAVLPLPQIGPWLRQAITGAKAA